MATHIERNEAFLNVFVDGSLERLASDRVVLVILQKADLHHANHGRLAHTRVSLCECNKKSHNANANESSGRKRVLANVEGRSTNNARCVGD